MYYCPACECSYPNGPEGPAEALRKHSDEHHDGERFDHDDDSAGPPEITGGHVILGLLALAALAWALRVLG